MRLRPPVLLVLVLAALLVALTPATVPTALAEPNAQGTSLQVTGVKAVQVIEDVPLVVGKATVVKVNVTAGARTQARLEVSLGASRKVNTVRVNRGANTLYVPVDPPGAPGSVEITARVSSTSGAGGNQIGGTAQVVSLVRNGIKVFFLPVDWNDQDRARFFAARYNSFVGESSDFFRAAYPFPEGNVQINSTGDNHMLNPQERSIIDSLGNISWENIMAMYTSVALAGRRFAPDADLVVGVLPPKWFARVLNEPKTVGLELHAVPQVVANQVDSDHATLAHEVGHTFGLGDEYDFGLRPRKIGNRVDLPGYWISRASPINPGSNPVYYSFMGASDPKSRYWVDRPTYMALIEMLQR